MFYATRRGEKGLSLPGRRASFWLSQRGRGSGGVTQALSRRGSAGGVEEGAVGIGYCQGLLW